MAALNFIVLFGVSYGVVLFIISVGLVVCFGLMRVANLAHGVFAALGGYITFTIMGSFSLPFFVALILSVLIVVAFSIVLEKIVFVELYKASELEQVLMTVGLCFIAIAALSLLYGPNVLPFRLPEYLNGNTLIFGQSIPKVRLYIVLAGCMLIVGLWYMFDRTPFGAQLRAAVDNRGMAQAIGINVDRCFSLAFALGAALAALGGAIGAVVLPLEPLYPFKHLPIFLTIVALSGFGNIKASLAVAILVGVVDTAGRYFVPQYGAFTIYLLLVGLMLWRPEGLLSPRK